MSIKNVSFVSQGLPQKQIVSVSQPRKETSPKEVDKSNLQKLGALSLIIAGVSIYTASQRLNWPIFKGIVARLFAKVFK